MKFLTKSLLGAGAAAAALVTVAAPAQAQRYDRYDRDRDGISAGEVIAGAVILGGLAAVIAAADNDRDYRYNDRYDYDRSGYRYRHNNRYGGGRAAINQCVNAVERWAEPLQPFGRDADPRHRPHALRLSCSRQSGCAGRLARTGSRVQSLRPL